VRAHRLASTSLFAGREWDGACESDRDNGEEGEGGETHSDVSYRYFLYVCGTVSRCALLSFVFHLSLMFFDIGTLDRGMCCCVMP
jgi:hypothetical protein